MGKLAAIVTLVLLAGCTCEQKFAAGETVKHRTLNLDNILVLDSGKFKNYQGYCLVQARLNTGAITNFVVDELERP